LLIVGLSDGDAPSVAVASDVPGLGAAPINRKAITVCEVRMLQQRIGIARQPIKSDAHMPWYTICASIRDYD
jgi:hypothetical protein